MTIYCGDALEVLPRLGKADLVLADPPYNVGKRYGVRDDSLEPGAYSAWMRLFLDACRLSSRDGVVFFPGTRNVLDVASFLPPGLKTHRILGWHRKEYAGDKWSGGPAMSWEPIIWASSAERPYYNRIFGSRGRDFLVVNATHGSPYARNHPCPKPPQVMAWLLGLFAPPKGTIIDPTAGTGTTLYAAKEAGLKAIGIEIEERYCEIAAKRCAQEVLAL